MYEDNSSEGGPKGSFENFKAEGDVLFKQGSYKKALDSFNTALELRPGDKNCLIARSQCYIHMGESQKALADADETLKEDPKYIKGLLQKAEAFYQMGQFEFALMYYHRGNKLRPEVQAFRLGIQKSQEAIDNSIGDDVGVRLENKGDLSFFFAEQKAKKSAKSRQGGYRPIAKREEKRKQRERKDRPQRDPKTVKQLLGELYSDKEYLETIIKETDTNDESNETNNTVHDLALQGLDYLDIRTDFWQQQKPMYARKKRPQDDNGNRGQGSPGGRRDPTPWVLRNLEQIDEAQVEGRHEDSLKQAKKVLKEIEKWSDDDISNRSEVVANLHSCIGNAYLELEEYSFALSHHNKDNEIATQKDLSDAKSRALDNLGRVHARMGNFEKAIEVWEEKLPMSKSSLESTWLYHEIGRCYLEMSDNQKAKDYGEKSLSAAEEASDDVWQLNACVLIAQSEVKLGELQEALDSFEKSLDMAKVQGDSAAEGAIKKALEDVNNRIVSGIKESGEEGAANEQNEETQSNDYEEDFEKDDEKESGDEKNKDSDKESDHGKKDDS